MKAAKDALDEENLVEPGTRATVWMGEKVETLNESVDMGVAKIEALPMDATPAEIEAARQASIEGLETYLDILLGPEDSEGARSGGMLDDPDIRFNLSGLSQNASEIRAQVEAAIAVATRNLTNAKPRGKPSWLVSQGGSGLFFVAPDGKDAAIAMGLDPDFLYIRSSTGEFLKTEQRAAPNPTSGNVPTGSGIGYAGIIDPNTQMPYFEQIDTATMSQNAITQAKQRNLSALEAMAKAGVNNVIERLPDNQNPDNFGVFSGRNIAGGTDPANVAIRDAVTALEKFTMPQMVPGAMGVSSPPLPSRATGFFSSQPELLTEFLSDPVGWWMQNSEKYGLN